MTDRAFGVRIRSALLILMAQGPELTNAGVKQWLRDGLQKKERELLNDRGLIVSTRIGQTFTHRLTDDGWAWCREELAAGGPPPRSGSMGGALYAVLLGLAGLVERSGLSLADLFGAAASVPIPASSPTPGPAGTSSGAPAEAVDVEAVIRARYRELAGFSNDWVRLADLRPRLDDLDRAAVDQALMVMNRLPDVNLAPEPVQSMLTDADHGAVVEIGGRANHLLAVDFDD